MTTLREQFQNSIRYECLVSALEEAIVEASITPIAVGTIVGHVSNFNNGNGLLPYASLTEYVDDKTNVIVTCDDGVQITWPAAGLFDADFLDLILVRNLQMATNIVTIVDQYLVHLLKAAVERQTGTELQAGVASETELDAFTQQRIELAKKQLSDEANSLKNVKPTDFSDPFLPS